MKQQLFIIDKDGKRMEVTDLDKAITQAGNFRTMQHLNPDFSELDQNLKSYWTDVHRKLLLLK